MLSAPNYGLAISPLQCVKWETAIANSVIDNIKENNGVYIPTNLQRDVLPLFHIDNIDWLEDTPDGKNTSHYLQMSIFQRKMQESLPISLNIEKDNTQSLTLKSNSFHDLLPYQKPNKSQFHRSPGCKTFCRTMNTCFPCLFFDTWIAFRSLGRFLIENSVSLQASTMELETQDIINDINQEPLQTTPITNETVFFITSW